MTAHIGDRVFTIGPANAKNMLEIRSAFVEAVLFEEDSRAELYRLDDRRVFAASEVFNTEGEARAEAQRRLDARKEIPA